MKKYFLIALGLIFGLSACQQAAPAEGEKKSTPDMDAMKVSAIQPATDGMTSAVADDYWRQGKAELNHYQVKQNRYRDLHEGEAVLVFVLEDFLYQKQVKNDNYTNPNSTPVLKTNKLLRFPTGLYDYSMMTSTFTPIDNTAFPQTLKVSHTGQDWCGQVFSQFNRTKEGYRLSSFSYFESEGDQEKTVAVNWVEDELYNRIRLDPEALPTGQVEMIPSSDVLRFLHLEFKAYRAEAERGTYEGKDFEGSKLMSYKVSYPEIRRELEIVYEGEKPYEIMGWKDSYPSVFDKKIRTTTAVRDEKLFTDYWTKNKRGDQGMRKEFGLETYLP